MAKTVALSQLRTDARLFADQRHGGATPFISDTELNRLINLKLAELYDKLVMARGHEYYADEGTLSIVASTARYNLPATFYEMLSVTLEWGLRDHEPVADLAHVRHASEFRNWSTWSGWSPKAYRIRNAQIEFFPVPSSSVTARIQFVPAFTDLATDGATFDGVNGWDKLVTLGVAVEMRAIEQNDHADLDVLYGEQLERIEALAADRDANPKRVIDVWPDAYNNRNTWFPRGRAE